MRIPNAIEPFERRYETVSRRIEASALRTASEIRSAYRDVEILRLDLEEYGMIRPDAAQSDAYGALSSKLEQLHERFALPRPPPGSAVAKLVRLAGLFCFFFLLCIPAMALMLPLRLLHPALRRLGVRNNWLPLDLVTKAAARGFLLSFGVRVISEGVGELDTLNPAIALYSHGSFLDPFVLQAASPILFKFIGKRSLFLLPIWGWLMRGYGNIPIDRSNRERAIKSLATAKKKLQYWQRSISIAPEGTRSSSGLLRDFKHGAFHMAHEVELPLLPVLIFGAYELWPPGQLFPNAGLVTVRFLSAIPVVADVSTDRLRVRIRRVMMEASALPPAQYASAKLAASYLSPYTALAWGWTGAMLLLPWLWLAVIIPRMRLAFAAALVASGLAAA